MLTPVVAAMVLGMAGMSLADEPPASTPPANQPEKSTPAEAAAPETTPASSESDAPAQAAAPEQASPYVLDFVMKDIDGNDVNLADYKGKVVLIVNVASKCGFTGQYKGLEELYQSKKDRGLVILGFPANNFGGQEPGTNAEIKAFCASKYSVTFPMFAKVSVAGDDKCDLYKRLAGQPAPLGGDPAWNFTKFLVDRDGKVVARYESRIRPNDTQLVTRIDDLLGPATVTSPAAGQGEAKAGG